MVSCLLLLLQSIHIIARSRNLFLVDIIWLQYFVYFFAVLVESNFFFQIRYFNLLMNPKRFFSFVKIKDKKIYFQSKCKNKINLFDISDIFNSEFDSGQQMSLPNRANAHCRERSWCGTCTNHDVNLFFSLQHLEERSSFIESKMVNFIF